MAAWQQLAQTTDIIKAEIDGVAVWGNNLVAWGSAGDANLTTTIWTSPDGLTWTAATDVAGLDNVDSVGAGGPGLIAFGAHNDVSIQDTQLEVASSTDGIHYSTTTVPKITGASVISSVAGPNGIVGVGSAETDTSAPAAVCLFSADGVTWTQAQATDGTFDGTELNDVHASANGYVAVGYSISDDLTFAAARAWVSADGQSWRSPGTFGGPFDQYGGSALGSSGLVVFTESQGYSNDVATDVKSTINGWLIPTAQLAP